MFSMDIWQLGTNTLDLNVLTFKKINHVFHSNSLFQEETNQEIAKGIFYVGNVSL